jgi:DNA-binding GntR family transcriptional regulator
MACSGEFLPAPAKWYLMNCDHSLGEDVGLAGRVPSPLRVRPAAPDRNRPDRSRQSAGRGGHATSDGQGKHAWTRALAPPERQTLNDQVYRDLRDLIMAGRLAPGQAITIRTLAHAVGVSPMPVRGALQRLLAEGALDLRANRSFVLPILSVEDFDEITRIRLSLEGLATEIATPLLKSHDLRRLREINREMFDGSRLSAIDYLGANQQFHFLVYRAAGMPRLTRIIESLWLQIGPLLNIATAEPNVASVRRFHQTIVRALAAGRAVDAAAAICSDISNAATLIRQWIAERAVDGHDVRSLKRRESRRAARARSR